MVKNGTTWDLSQIAGIMARGVTTWGLPHARGVLAAGLPQVKGAMIWGSTTGQRFYIEGVFHSQGW